MTKKVTITDLAKRANVSVTTVSQILNGKDDRFSSKTVKKVRQLQKEMGYAPDFNAQSLIRRSGRTIGVLVPNINNPFFSRFLRGIESEAMAHDYIPLIFGSNNNQKLESHYLFESIRRAADGMIIASAISDLSYIDNILTQNGIPYLLIDQAPVVKGDKVDVNNRLGGALLANYLIKKGHQRVVVVADENPTLNMEERLNGFLETYRKAGIPVNDDQIVKTTLTKDGGYQATNQALLQKPTAIFAINDEIAIGLYRGIHEAGLTIPDDISIVGYDDIDLAEYITPKLTTVHQPAFEMGTTAAQLIIKRIENQSEPIQRVSLPVKLVERQSVERKID
ncbi:LacI family transcriptional regulator [Lentilactobacillus diolivorans]|uniref:Transcriptional regulator n=2 Tax=Lentilactobacillus diolivorans TaxID=179838 RepID=A0A0R1SHP8_9LACO|nr:LacI family DNA-binding transcriptional regulator [Lentilactobacillus diolivorans]KRL65717.1 transcriptional regulator [Lentilactobacillus diolivorans DSM 14421]MDH5105438.1 LacI family transcriptional regulator [Lentilactobacillus diolivorans]RRG01168.1 MAG: LacI family transcriptional regulator [Lactobacillus sp.]GEP24363.1 LacI family transcriptional regulator [Lentilactobacillus diolivorans]